jgi:HSF-type DNA-binding
MNEVVQVGPSSRSRRSQRKEDEEPVSLFLRKAYHVVCNCPPSLGKMQHRILNLEILLLSSELTSSPFCTPPDFFPGGWSVKGDTFIIKDAKKFSEKVIPTVYKHNNFSSFVRQLNFCKFRWSSLRGCLSHFGLVSVYHPRIDIDIFSISIPDGFRKIKSDLSSIENPFWEFRHPKFVRGMPELLSEIKKAVTSGKHLILPQYICYELFPSLCSMTYP